MNYEVRQSNDGGAFLIAYQGTKPVYLHRYNDVNGGGLMRDVIAIRENGDTSTWVGNELVYYMLDEVYAQTKPIDVDGELITENMGVDAKNAYGAEE